MLEGEPVDSGKTVIMGFQALFVKMTVEGVVENNGILVMGQQKQRTIYMANGHSAGSHNFGDYLGPENSKNGGHIT